jgi:hypothetical protein
VTKVTPRRRCRREDRADPDKERAMKSNFSQTLELDNDGRRVRARGPIDWATDNRGEEVVEFRATITQNGVTAHGERGPFKKGEDSTWWCDADTNGGLSLQPGVADATGTILVKTPGGLSEIQWPDTVTLKRRSWVRRLLSRFT